MGRCAECGRTDGITFEKGRWLCPECRNLQRGKIFVPSVKASRIEGE